MRSARIAYSAREMAWLETNRTLVISDYHRAFVETFDRLDVTAANLHGLRKRMGWKVGRAPGRTAGRHRSYSAAEIAWLRDNRTLPIGDCHAAFVATFEREVSADKLHALRKRMGWKTGRTGHFVQGQAPANKGKPCPAGVGGRHPNARKTQFRRGQEPHNTKPLGHERVNVDGYVEISIAETNPRTGYARRYVHKHVHLWERANGPTPDGHVLKCVDGDRLNTDPANWTPIPRGVLPRLNGGKATRIMAYDSAPAALKPALLAVARIEQRTHELRRGGASR